MMVLVQYKAGATLHIVVRSPAHAPLLSISARVPTLLVN